MRTRKEILEMLSTGEINATRAEEMLQAAHNAVPVPDVPPAPASKPVSALRADKAGRRWLHIEVSELESGKKRVRVNVPLGLVHFGFKVGARFTDEVDANIMRDVLEALDDPTVKGTLIEVEDVDDDEHVHIYVD
jgi:hypothetical protein